MCIGIPVRIIEPGHGVARCTGRNGEEYVNMMLVGPQPAGTWVVTFRGSAREVLTEEEAATINEALDGLEAVIRGDADVDLDTLFPDPDRPGVPPK